MLNALAFVTAIYAQRRHTLLFGNLRQMRTERCRSTRRCRWCLFIFLIRILPYGFRVYYCFGARVLLIWISFIQFYIFGSQRLRLRLVFALNDSFFVVVAAARWYDEESNFSQCCCLHLTQTTMSVFISQCSHSVLCRISRLRTQRMSVMSLHNCFCFNFTFSCLFLVILNCISVFFCGNFSPLLLRSIKFVRIKWST